MTNCLMLLDTTGLDYDDRVRKEAVSVARLGESIHIVALEYANESGEREVYGRIPATTISLRSRRWFPRGKRLSIKLLESYLRFIAQVVSRRPAAVWFHNLNFAMLTPILALLKSVGFTRCLVWDQHELPFDRVVNNKALMRIFGVMINMCDVVVMASEDRKQLLAERMPRVKTPIVSLENYPDAEFADQPREPMPEDISNWLDGSPYLLAQGGANPHRHLHELANAIMTLRVWKLIVVGPYQQVQIDSLRQEYGDDLDHWIRFTGFVPQFDIVPLIDAAAASVVFYDTRILNLNYCAPNRFYQALCRGIPVVVGENPPLRRVVDTYHCGVVVDSASSESICLGLERLSTHYEQIARQARASSDLFRWETQDYEVEYIISHFSSRGLTVLQ